MKLIDRFLNFFYGILFFLTPLIFTFNTSELFEFNKMIFIYFITILIVTLWVIKMILAKKILFKKTYLDIPILLFLISQIISSFFSIDRHVSLFGYYGRFNGGLVSIISYIILYYGFISNSINFNNILKTSLVSSFFVMLYGLPGKLGHDITCLLVTKGTQFDNSCWDNASLQFRPEIRTFSTLGQPNWLGAYLAINFFIGVYFLVKNYKENKYLILNTFYLLINFTFILFTRSRSALASLTIGLFLFLLYYLIFIKTDFKKLTINLLLIAIIPTLLFKTGIDRLDKIIDFPSQVLRQSKTAPVKSNSVSLSETNVTDSLDIRKIVWQGAIELGAKYPFFGTGVETFAYSYNFVRPVAHNLTSEWDFIYNKAHNEFLNYLATTGFIGLGSYLLIIFIFFLYVIKKITYNYHFNQTYNKNTKLKNEDIKKNLDLNFNRNILLISLFTSYLTILITNFFGFSTTTINLYYYLIPVFVFMLYNPEETNYFDTKEHNIYQLISIFIVVGLSLYLLFSVFSYWLADTYYAQGTNYTKPQVSDYQQAAVLFEKALKIRYEPNYEDRLSSSLSYLAAIASYQKEVEISKKLIELSDYYNKKTLNNYPKNIFFWKTQAKNHYLFYEITLDTKYLISGLRALDESRKIAPTDPKIPYSIAVYYSLLYDMERNYNQRQIYKTKSLEEIDLAIKLKNNFNDGINLKKDLLNKYLLN